MNTSDRLKDVFALEHYRVVLSKTETYPEIARALEEIGYGPKILEEGRELLKSTREMYEDNIRKKDELSFVKDAFRKQKAKMDRNFRLHRNMAKILLRNDEVKSKKFAFSGAYPRRYAIWIETMRYFYNESARNPEIQESLLNLRFTKEDVEEGLAGIKELERLNAERYYLKGTSEQSTADKRDAFDSLHDWMSGFFARAKLVLKEEPELLEALCKPTR